ncbi:MAG: peptidase DmpA [Acidobacteria bacterium]|nr:peptidase DmpA [Acidobacteriota bacterium]
MTLTAVPGVRVGHWTDPVGLTGVTVVLLPQPNVTTGEVRGAAPGTRETALLAPGMKVEEVQAIALCGGSAFGLAAADGVVAELERDGRGFPTPTGVVPIVPAAVLYDLAVGDPRARPGPAQGAAAYRAATSAPVAMGNVGAGTGATVAGWRGPAAVRKGGLGSAAARAGEATVGALAVVNAVGDAFTLEGVPLTGGPPVPAAFPAVPLRSLESTTLVVVATDAALDRAALTRVCVRAHDALAACLRPSHTRYDGDAVFAASCGRLPGDPDVVAEAAFVVVGRSIEAALRAARPVAGIPALEEGG